MTPTEQPTRACVMHHRPPSLLAAHRPYLHLDFGQDRPAHTTPRSDPAAFTPSLVDHFSLPPSASTKKNTPYRPYATRARPSSLPTHPALQSIPLPSSPVRSSSMHAHLRQYRASRVLTSHLRPYQPQHRNPQCLRPELFTFTASNRLRGDLIPQRRAARARWHVLFAYFTAQGHGCSAHARPQRSL